MRKTHNTKFLLFAVPVGLIATGTIAFFVTRSPKPDQTCTDNVARLEALASSDISQTEKMLRNLKNKEKSAAETASQEGIADGSSVLDDVAIKQAFQGTVIIGDSITESIWEYGFLDTDVVVSKRGLSIAAADEQIETAIGLQPSVIFMAFGSNDLETYIDDSDAFIDAYRIQVQKLKDALLILPFISMESCQSCSLPLILYRRLDITRNIMKLFRPFVRKRDALTLTILLLWMAMNLCMSQTVSM